ncbi:MAG: DUF4396 domain-containing protein [Pseudomonadota bacterium]
MAADTAARAAEACHGHHDVTLRMAASSTLHCLTGCVIGEVSGLMIGVSLGLGVWPTILLATALAYLSGFTLGLWPLVRTQGLTMVAAFKVIWIGEVVSIGVMEIVMNAVDYSVGGVQAHSVMAPIFWLGIAAAVPAGFLAALPVNWWLLKRNLKNCH